ncbi:MAG: CRTAC1 family protein [Anaerolineae bacterium]
MDRIMGIVLLLLLVGCTVPEFEPGPVEVRFRDVTEQAGVGNPAGVGDAFHIPKSGTKDERLREVVMRGGTAWFDYDNDGDLDLYAVNDGPNALYRNNGDGTFTDVAKEAGADNPVSAMGVSVADYDNDGDLDLYVTNIYWPNALLRNNGDGTFTDVAEHAGVTDRHFAAGSAWGDYDGDGWVDLYVAHYLREANVLYHNNGDGTFTDVSLQTRTNDAGYGFQPLWTDYDMDGDVDLYVINDFTDNVLYRNEGGGRFTDVTVATGTAAVGGGMGGAVGDYDNDGDFDLFITQFEEDTLLANTGGIFSDLSFKADVANPLIGWGTEFFDYDNDGDLDLFVNNGFIMDNSREREEPNALYRNDGEGSFSDVAPALGLDIRNVGRGAAFGDYDSDGDLDMYVCNIDRPGILYRNDGGNSNHWLMVRTVGAASNRAGIGAKVWVTAGDRRQVREVRSGSSFLSHNSLDVHFGLGRYTGPVTVEIRWPSGIGQTLTNVRVDQLLTVTEETR